MVQRFFILVLLIQLFFVHTTKSQSPLPYNGKQFPSLNGYYQWLEDVSGLLKPNQVVALQQQKAFKTWKGGKTFNKGLSPYIYWLYLPVKNVTNEQQQAILRIGTGIDSVWLYTTVTNDSLSLLYNTSRYTSLKERPFTFRQTAFPVKLAANKTVQLYLRIDNRNKGVYLPIYFQSIEKVLVDDKNRHWLYGIYFGIFLFIIIFNIFLFVSMKDSIHLWYSAYVFAAVLFMIQDEKFYTELYPPSWLGFFENAWIPPFSLLMIGFGLRVMQLFVGQTRLNSRWFLYVKALIILSISSSIFMLCLSFIEPTSVLSLLEKLYFFTDILVPVSFILLFASLLEKIFQKKYLALYYLIAVLFVVIGSANFYLNHLGVLNINILQPNGVVVGLAFEIIFLSLLLTIRYNNIKKEKEKFISLQERKMVDAVIETEERERNRIAQDLHDGIGSSIVSIRLMLQNDFAKNESLNENEKSYRKKLLDNLKTISGELRSISHNLMPKDIEISGFVSTVSNLFYFLNENNKDIIFSFIYEGEITKLNKNIQIQVYRIVNELTQNIINHSKATQATLQCLLYNNVLQVMMEDNGKGFDLQVKKEGIGLTNIKSRIKYIKGTLHIDSSIKGTTFLIEIPVHHE